MMGNFCLLASLQVLSQGKNERLITPTVKDTVASDCGAHTLAQDEQDAFLLRVVCYNILGQISVARNKPLKKAAPETCAKRQSGTPRFDRFFAFGPTSPLSCTYSHAVHWRLPKPTEKGAESARLRLDLASAARKRTLLCCKFNFPTAILRIPRSFSAVPKRE